MSVLRYWLFMTLLTLWLAPACRPATSAQTQTPVPPSPTYTPGAPAPPTQTSAPVTPSPSSSIPTPIPTPVNTGYIYAQKIDEIDAQNRGWSIYRIYAEDQTTQAQTPLFEVGAVGDYPLEIELLASRGKVLVNLEHKLDLFDLTTGQSQTLLSLDPDQTDILDIAVSPDEREIAVTWAQGVYHPAEESLYELSVINLDDGQQRQLLKNPVDPVSMTPRAWKDDGSVIFLYEHIPAGIIGPLWRIDADGQNLTQLDVLANGLISPDGEWVAAAENNGTEPIFLCYANDQNRLRLYAPFTGDELIIFEEDTQQVIARDWSPQSDTFIYEVRRPLSGESCGTEFAPSQFFLYDIASGQSRLIESVEAQLAAWDVEAPLIEQRQREQTYQSDLIYLGLASPAQTE